MRSDKVSVASLRSATAALFSGSPPKITGRYCDGLTRAQNIPSTASSDKAPGFGFSDKRIARRSVSASVNT
jgi:hypothetical protein